MAKVSDVLKLSVMRGVRVVAGEEGLFRKVEHVTVMEVPEIKRWLKGNDFLITSFYSVRKSEEDQCALIRDLADTCCCIAVKTGQYVKTVAESVKRAADEVGLPVLEIPGELAYIDIIVNVMNLIFEEEGNSEILEKYVKDFHRKFPDVRIIGHNELAAKACPSFDVQEWLKEIGINQ